ncbi:hypothetical protein BABINDRAFT_174432 [Babjeviella inositovora NRRL Y-12698]|uniref:Uncharacterized protein n=1 Tax=Babjeviella inositovora NRRL Y-12698 TaxID=984486 RepID=A0A1E3QVY4_9ASCO|nr:uncharacterized protein BABINDRAFT_174432 [Babjeviella inositovora NRRL Y-12698]ODQ81825.1 hypothetical protein BABINDRAFT_174432 [Babjeviella inositovora NRRL Y-12698]
MDSRSLSLPSFQTLTRELPNISPEFGIDPLDTGTRDNISLGLLLATPHQNKVTRIQEANPQIARPFPRDLELFNGTKRFQMHRAKEGNAYPRLRSCMFKPLIPRDSSGREQTPPSSTSGRSYTLLLSEYKQLVNLYTRLARDSRKALENTTATILDLQSTSRSSKEALQAQLKVNDKVILALVNLRDTLQTFPKQKDLELQEVDQALGMIINSLSYGNDPSSINPEPKELMYRTTINHADMRDDQKDKGKAADSISEEIPALRLSFENQAQYSLFEDTTTKALEFHTEDGGKLDVDTDCESLVFDDNGIIREYSYFVLPWSSTYT